MRDALEEHAAALRGRLRADVRPSAIRLFFVGAATRSVMGLVLRGPTRPGRGWTAQLLVDLSREIARVYSALGTPEARRLHRRIAGAFPKTVEIAERRPAGVRAVEVTPPGPARGRVIYLHGGGFTLGSPETHGRLAAALAVASSATVTALDYRLAPEHPHPAALDDLDAVLDALLEAEGSLGGCALAGDSAGGAIVLSTLVRRRSRGLPIPVAAALMSPATDLTLRAASIDENGPHDYLSRSELESCARSYTRGADPRDPSMSPLFGELAGLPPLLVHASRDEVLRDDAIALHERARAAGVDCTLHLYDGVFHDFHTAQASLEEARAAVRELGGFLRRHLDAAVTRGAAPGAIATSKEGGP